MLPEQKGRSPGQENSSQGRSYGQEGIVLPNSGADEDVRHNPLQDHNPGPIRS